MVPTQTLVTATATAVAVDTASLHPASALKVFLVAQNFTPGLATDKTALTLATFTGSTALAAGTGAVTNGRDPVTGRRKLILPEPAGGWTWKCTADPTPSETITGYVVTDNAGTVTYGSKLLDTPVTVSTSGDLVSVPEVSVLLAEVPWE